jgi:surfactin synthase thioesterase subunit
MDKPLLRMIPQTGENAPSRAERLVVFHHAGGNGNLYAPFLRNETRASEVWVMDLPGRGFRSNEPPIENYVQLRQRLLVELKPILDRPVVLFGHSMGALIAHDLTAQIERLGLGRVARLGVSGLGAPTQRAIRQRENLSNHSEPEFLWEFEKYGPIPLEIKNHPELFASFVKSARADIRLMETYPSQTETVHFAETYVFGGAEDPKVSREDLQQWQTICFNAKEPIVLPGGHFFLFERFDQILDTLFI